MQEYEHKTLEGSLKEQRIHNSPIIKCLQFCCLCYEWQKKVGVCALYVFSKFSSFN